jgi:hypothetical protein
MRPTTEENGKGGAKLPTAGRVRYTHPVAGMNMGMTTFKVAFGEPSGGWLGFEVRSDAEAFSETFSFIYPTLPDLCNALCDVLSGRSPGRVVFLLEPAEVELRLTPLDDSRCSLRLCTFTDSRRTSPDGVPVFEMAGETTEIVLTLWRALRRLQTNLSESDFEERWKEPFPKFEMTALTELLTERGLLHQKARI